MANKLLPVIAVLPAAAYSIITFWSGWRFFCEASKRMTAGQDFTDINNNETENITIMKPVKGKDEDSYQNFASFCHQTHKGKIQIIFAVASPDDPAIPVIRQIMYDYPDADIEINIDAEIHGPNHKVSNLLNAFPRARYDIIVFCDSDIRVGPNFISSVAGHFRNGDVGLVTSPYRSSKVFGPATAIEALSFTSEMVPNVMVALKLEGLSFALGASMAVRRNALADIGGLQSLLCYLADDYQLGNKIHRAGWRLVLDSEFAESVMQNERFPDLFSRQLRWARTMRVSRPGGYLASGLTMPGLAIIASLAFWNSKTSIAAILSLYLIRLTVSTIFSRIWTKDMLLPKWWWLLPVRDIIASITWLLAFTGNRVNWRGNLFKISTDGTLTRIKPD